MIEPGPARGVDVQAFLVVVDDGVALDVGRRGAPAEDAALPFFEPVVEDPGGALVLGDDAVPAPGEAVAGDQRRGADGQNTGLGLLDAGAFDTAGSPVDGNAGPADRLAGRHRHRAEDHRRLFGAAHLDLAAHQQLRGRREVFGVDLGALRVAHVDGRPRLDDQPRPFGHQHVADHQQVSRQNRLAGEPSLDLPHRFQCGLGSRRRRAARDHQKGKNG